MSPFDLTANTPRGDTSLATCPLTGGFLFDGVAEMIGSSEKHDVNMMCCCTKLIHTIKFNVLLILFYKICNGGTFPGQLHSDCTMNEGILLQFPDRRCVPPSTGWTTGTRWRHQQISIDWSVLLIVEEELVCLDSWIADEADQYIFAIVGTKFFEPQYCLVRITHALVTIWRTCVLVKQKNVFLAV